MIDSKNGIIGLAIGDAMGVPLEFCMREKLMENPTTEMKGYGSHDVPKGSWSDDTSMTLCLIDAINKKNGIDLNAICDNFCKWVIDEEFTPTGKRFDIGRTCLQAIINYQNGKEPELCGLDNEFSNGNGSLMRILPLVYYCYCKNMNKEEIYNCVKKVSSLTHRHEVSILGCYIYVLYGIELLKGNEKKEAYLTIKTENYKYFSKSSLEKYYRILEEDISEFSINDISSAGYIVSTLEATLWCFLTTDNYDEAIIKAINLGSDTDTVGACVGGLAGIYYGVNSINENWKKDLIKYDYIEKMCYVFNNVILEEKIKYESEVREATFNEKNELETYSISTKELRNCSCLDLVVDAVVNAANRYLVSGGGICGAIFSKAGHYELTNACKLIKTPLDDGDAVITSAFNISNSKCIIHAVGPNFAQTPEAFDKLFNAYYNSFKLLKENNIHSISFPLISAGIFGGRLENPVAESTKQFINAFNRFTKENPFYIIKAYLCAFTQEEYKEAQNIFQNNNI